LLCLEGIAKTFKGEGAGETLALVDLDLKVETGQYLMIVGPNGSGKSTLLGIISGEVMADKGNAMLLCSKGMIDLLSTPRRKKGQFMARVEQDPTLGTIPDLTVWENLWLATGVKSGGALLGFGSSAKVCKAQGKLLAELGFASRLDVRVRDLSGGQRQVVAVLLAVLRKPMLLLLDEHTASLDRRNASICVELSMRLAREAGSTILSVTHNLEEAITFGDRVIVMSRGRVSRDLSRVEMDKLGAEGLAALIREVDR
jgi:putative tryptophan/tyrosine transport system ATP-binding protein